MLDALVQRKSEFDRHVSKLEKDSGRERAIEYGVKVLNDFKMDHGAPLQITLLAFFCMYSNAET